MGNKRLGEMEEERERDWGERGKEIGDVVGVWGGFREEVRPNWKYHGYL
jgi:hypothetical protein